LESPGFSQGSTSKRQSNARASRAHGIVENRRVSGKRLFDLAAALTGRRSTTTMSDITQLHRELIARVLDSDGKAPTELRQAAFDNTGLDEPIRTLIEKVTYHAHRVTDEDIAAVRAAGLSEDQVFEIVVCAAIGQASRQYKNAFAALASVTEEGKR
jgi:hypothetical protein